MTEVTIPASFSKFASQFHQDSDVVFNDANYLIDFTRHNLSKSELADLVELALSIKPIHDQTLERAWKASAAEVVFSGHVIRKLLLLISKSTA